MVIDDLEFVRARKVSTWDEAKKVRAGAAAGSSTPQEHNQPTTTLNFRLLPEALRPERLVGIEESFWG